MQLVSGKYTVFQVGWRGSSAHAWIHLACTGSPCVRVCVCVSAILDYFVRQLADRTCSIKMENTRAKVIVRGKQQVFVPPLSAGSIFVQTVSGFCGSEEASSLRVVGKILLKAFSQNKKASKTFTLRNLPLASINSVNQLKTEIKRQLQSDVNEDFDVGYLEGSTQISFRSSHDLSEIWSDVSKGKKVTLWCDGLKEREQEKRCLRADEDQELLHPAKKRKSKVTDEKTVWLKIQCRLSKKIMEKVSLRCSIEYGRR